MTYERQAAQLAEYAAGVAGMKRFGILYPRDGYGLGLSAAFRDQVERRGGSIVGALAYTPGAEEFSVEVVSVQKWMDTAGMQAVFIPDFAATATVLAGELRESRPGIFLLGSNGWNDPGQLGAAGDSLDGAVFVDGFFIGSQRKATSDFILSYRQEYGDQPQILEAQAYDAARILAMAMRSGERSRDRITRFIRGLETVEGVGGQIAMGPQGVQRELFLLRLSDGRISEIAVAGAGGGYASPVPIIRAEPHAPDNPLFLPPHE
jgi:ABC-type branched-subunit amino acid transport system substrate-binding protein